MRYMIPEDYDSFRCLAGACPDTCCRGWQISIDRNSLKKYARMPGPFGNRLRNSIDWRNGCFLQWEGGCELLGEDGLCDLQLEAGEEALCDTCRFYPRHEEEFENVRELSLSLSCPEAARMILFREEPLRFLVWETDEEDDFEEFDAALFGDLQELRRSLLRAAQDRKIPLSERLRRIFLLGQQAQAELEQAREDSKNTVPLIRKEPAGLKESLALLRSLALWDERWEAMLENAWEQLQLAEDDLGRCALEWMERNPTAGEQLLVQFLYVYLCGAVYDRQIASKTAMAVLCVQCIFLVAAGNAPSEPGHGEKELLTETAWRLARTIEHNDENLLRLEAALAGSLSAHG